LKEWTILDSRNTPSNINLEEEGIMDDLRNDGSASVPEQVSRPNPWKKKKKKTKMMMMMIWNLDNTDNMLHYSLLNALPYYLFTLFHTYVSNTTVCGFTN
jgi:hypothetical protein